MRSRTAVFGTLGALATLVAALFVLVPELGTGPGPLGQVVAPVASADPKAVMAAAAAVVGAYLLVVARSAGGVGGPVRRSAAEKRFDAARTDPPEAVTADRRTTTGAGIDTDVERAVAGGGRPLHSVRDLLRELATEAYADAWGVPDSQARTAVETGRWTAQELPAAFLAGDAGPTASVLSRVRLWLSPERERRRRIEATLAEIERLRGAR